MKTQLIEINNYFRFWNDEYIDFTMRFLFFSLKTHFIVEKMLPFSNSSVFSGTKSDVVCTLGCKM